MAFAINLMMRGAATAKQSFVAVKDGILGMVGAEDRLAAATDRAARAADRQAASIAKVASAARAAQSATARGIDPTTGVASSVAGGGVGSAVGFRTVGRRHALLSSIAQSGQADWARMAAGRGGDAEGPNTLASRIARAMGRVGGAAGGTLGRIGGALGAPTAALGAIGLGAAAAGLALKELSAAVTRHADEIKQIVQIQGSLRTSLKGMVDSANNSANAAARGERGNIARLIGAGTLGMGQDLAKKYGPDGLAAQAELDKAGLGTNTAANAAIRRGADTGLGSVGDFAKFLAKHKGVMGAGGTDDVVASMLSGMGHGQVNVAQQAKAFGGSAFGKAFAGMDAADGRVQAAAHGRFAGGGTQSGTFAQANAITNPEAAARTAMMIELQEQQAILDKIANSQGKMLALWDAISAGSGSAANTSQRNARITSAAVDGVP